MHALRYVRRPIDFSTRRLRLLGSPDLKQSELEGAAKFFQIGEDRSRAKLFVIWLSAEKYDGFRPDDEAAGLHSPVVGRIEGRRTHNSPKFSAKNRRVI